MSHVSIIGLAAALALATPVLAGGRLPAPEDIVEAEILPGWRTADGTHMAALHLRLEPGWKTYWRAPGDAGIPPRFDWTESDNIGSVEFHWPRPTVFDLNGMRAIGYTRDLVLPIEITPRDPARPVGIAAAMEIGVCRDVCVPVALSVTGRLADKGRHTAAIATALDAAPDAARKAGLTAVTCRIEPIKDGLRVIAQMEMPQLGRGEEVAVFELPDPSIWISEAKTTRLGRSLTATTDMVPTNGVPFVLDRSVVTITVLAGPEAVELTGCPAG